MTAVDALRRLADAVDEYSAELAKQHGLLITPNLAIAAQDARAALAEAEKGESEAVTALRLMADWIGPPATDAHSYDYQRERAWEMAQRVFAKHATPHQD